MRRIRRASIFARRERRGFVLILAIGLLAIMMVFLVAAQGSVMVSALQIKRSGERGARADTTTDLLAQAVHALRAGAAENASAPAQAQLANAEAKQTFRRVAVGDPIYAALPGIEHREGDAIVEIAWSEAGAEERARYLVNGEGRRPGAIRIGKP